MDKKQFDVYLAVSTVEELRNLAKARGVSTSDLITELIERELASTTAEEKLAMAVISRAKRQYEERKLAKQKEQA